MLKLNTRKKSVKYLLGLSVILLVFNFVPLAPDHFHMRPIPGERFNEGLVKKVQSIDGLLAAAKVKADSAGAIKGSVSYALIMHDLVRERFHQGYSTYRLSQNWIAALSGYAAPDFAAMVIPEDIMIIDMYGTNRIIFPDLHR
ncbi:MAG: hypothetical protein EOP50_17065 [Sphingobacteriales bacterium]|nr:MAG: hypothetical protein EOP50_17065 [Sphingobacteriales bacterium]